ncbi:MAG TPA: V-type ATP synthase subunit A, partial [Firmicutes bacterium]|nr:V-type ATP synthase subunit A [Bacillota bacterium]
ESSLTVIGSVSPPGGDLADPVVQATLRVVKVFWSLEDTLAFQRHFPAISWLNSYSLYSTNLEDYFKTNINREFPSLQAEAMRLLQQEAELAEIVRLVGIEAMSDRDRLILETSRSIREDFLHQNAFMEIDTYTSLTKQYRMLKLIMELHRISQLALEKGVSIDQLASLPVKEEIARAKLIPEDQLDRFDQLEKEVRTQVEALMEKEESVNA